VNFIVLGYFIVAPNHRRRLHGNYGGDRLHGQKVLGRCPHVALTGILLCHFERVKCTVKTQIYHYASDISCADVSLKMHQKRLAAVLRLDPLVGLTALDLLAGFKNTVSDRTLVTVLHLNHSPSMDTLWRSLISLSTWAA